MREKLAEHAHDSWTGWMEYLFSQSELKSNGTVVIPVGSVKRWLRQMHTPYANLSESEKESDRVEADKILAIIEETK